MSVEPAVILGACGALSSMAAAIAALRHAARLRAEEQSRAARNPVRFAPIARGPARVQERDPLDDSDLLSVIAAQIPPPPPAEDVTTLEELVRRRRSGEA